MNDLTTDFTSGLSTVSEISTNHVYPTTFENVTTNYDVSKPLIISSGPLVAAVNHELFVNTLLPSLVYVCVLLLVGIPGNLLVVYVYAFKWSRSTSRTFILALGSYDLLNCLTSLTTEIALIIDFFQFDIPIWCKLSRFITASINSGSTFLLVAIAIDRFKRICRIHQRSVNSSQARKLVFISVLFALATSWPALFLYGTFTIPVPVHGIIVVGKTCLIEDQISHSIYPFIFVIFLLSCHFIVDAILIVLYTMIGKKMFSQRKIQKSLRGSRHKPEVSKAKAKVMTSISPEVSHNFPTKPEISQTSFTMEDLEDSEPKRHASFVILERSRKANNKTKARPIKPVQRKMFVKELKQSIKSRTSNNSMENERGRRIHAGKTTLMLFLVTVGFVVAFLPYSILVIIRYTDEGFYYSRSNVGKSLYQLFLRSYLLHSVWNPFVYCFVSKQFRVQSKTAFKAVCCCHEE